MTLAKNITISNFLRQLTQFSFSDFKQQQRSVLFFGIYAIKYHASKNPENWGYVNVCFEIMSSYENMISQKN